MKNLKKWAALVLSATLLCGCASSGGNSSSPSNLTLSEKEGNPTGVMYGDSIDFTKWIDVSSSSAGQVYSVSATSLTPDTLTIDSTNLSKAMATGVGECKAEIAVMDKKLVLSFVSYAYVSSFKITNPGEMLVGESFNLDDYVTVNVSKPVGANGEYFATSSNEETAVIGEDGKTVHIVGAGKVSIKITDFTKKRPAYLSSTAVSSFQREMKSFTSKIKNNYTVYSTYKGSFVDGFALYHTADYSFYPYQFLLGTSSWGNRPPYHALASFPSGNVYTLTADYTSIDEGKVDLSSLKVAEKLAYGKDQYYAFDTFPSEVIDAMKYATSGESEYLTCSFTSSVNEKILGGVMGLSFPNGSFSSVNASMEKIFEGTSKEQVALVLSFLTSSGEGVEIAIGDVGTTKIEGMDEFLSDSSNEPASISSDPIKERLSSVAALSNYTLKGRSYCRDDDGNELTVQQAAQKAEILHLLYYTGTSKYTESGYFNRNIQSYKGVGSGSLPDHQYTEGYLCKDNKVYPVSCQTDEKGVEVLDGTLSLGEAIVQGGEEISSYWDYTGLNSLRNLEQSGYDDLNVLSYEEESSTYRFNLKPTGKKGTELLRGIGLSCLYASYPNQMFPSNIGDNSYESGYFGEGSITLKEDGGFSFFYYISVTTQASTSGNVSYQMAIEVETSDIGTTSIEEYSSL